MLGYGIETKSYQLYDVGADVEREEVSFSRDVVFNATKNGMEKEPAPKELDQDVFSLNAQLKSTTVNVSMKRTNRTLQ